MEHSHFKTTIKWCLWVTIIWIANLSRASSTTTDDDYLIGLGSYDITGPAGDVNLMGYAKASQTAAGIHLRLRARTFILASAHIPNKRFAFINCDSHAGSDIITLKVLEILKLRYGDLYTADNVAITGIHSHSGPAGFYQYLLYLFTSFGFVHQSYEALVNGIVLSIVQAHENLRPGSIFVNIGELLEANINRSPSAYLNNPAEERALYQHDIETNMTLLKFVDKEGNPLGAFNWFSTHGTSMTENNRLLSSDNKGTASRLMEDLYNGKDVSIHDEKLICDSIGCDMPEMLRQGIFLKHAEKELKNDNQQHSRNSTFVPRIRSGKENQFIAAFCQSNEGDASPNTLGAFCTDTGLPCDFYTSTCNGKSEGCIARGPGYPDDFASTRIIGERQFQKAVSLMSTASEKVAGDIDYRHTYVDFTKVEVVLPSTSAEGEKGSVVTTCPAALGYSFAAGTTDGPGAFDFVQGDDDGKNPFWKLVRDIIRAPSEKQKQCHGPKPILLDAGEVDIPYSWAPSVLPLQILRLGNVVLLCVPSEFTTMAGRRLRTAVKETLIAKGKGQFDENTIVVIAGLSNSYSQYVTTFEEYQVQRYEGASTLYGPHTLTAYIQEFTKLATALAEGKMVNPGKPPHIGLLHHKLELLPGVVHDDTPSNAQFGDIIEDVKLDNGHAKAGDVVTARFWSASPRNDLFTEGTFALVELLDESGEWKPVYDDDDLSLQFIWNRPKPLSADSEATVRWEIPHSAPAGTYRLRHFGAAKTNVLGHDLHYFSGTSSPFVVS